MPGHHCAGWSESKVTPSQRRVADRRMDAHVAKRPQCSAADVCVHTGVIFDSAYCCTCGRKIG